MTENTLKGIYNGGTIPFGYMIEETRHYQPDPLLAPYVEQTFQKYADGATMTDLRAWCGSVITRYCYFMQRVISSLL